jgi:hypothetical protein
MNSNLSLYDSMVRPCNSTYYFEVFYYSLGMMISMIVVILILCLETHHEKLLLSTGQILLQILPNGDLHCSMYHQVL